MSRICMIGTGYVGLVSGACLADFGHEVWCVDINEQRIADLHAGKMPIYEPGLDRLVAKGVEGNRLFFTTSLAEAMESTDTIFIAVQTPMSDSGEADLTYVVKVAEEIGRLMKKPYVIVTKSTVPVGTSRKVKQAVSAAQPKPIPFDMASNPEFLREGSSIEDFMRPDRVVIGTESENAEKVMREIYRPLYLLETPIVHGSIESAELIKYASNAFLAVKISYINEISQLADRVGADVSLVARAMGLDKRIGPKFLHAGLGFGGSCLPKDTNAIVHIAGEAGGDMSIVRAAIAVNAALPDVAMDKAREMLPDLKGRTVALLGLSFKPNTDDIRDAPARPLVRLLQEAGAELRVHDPVAMDNFRGIHPELMYCDGPYHAIEGTDLTMLLTEWNEYRQLDLPRIAGLMAGRRFLDCRNVYNGEMMAEHDIDYRSFGRPGGGSST